MSDNFRKKSTVYGLLLSIIVSGLSLGLAGYEIYKNQELSNGIIGLLLVAFFMTFINWLNYSKFRKDNNQNSLNN